MTSPPRGERNRYLDLTRLLAICAVVVGHWLLVNITYSRGVLSGVDDIHDISWAGWATLLFQVLPAFFLVGGYVDALSWTSHHARGETWADWVRGRVMRLMWPTAVFVAVGSLAAWAAKAAGAGSGELARAGWVVALQLWFLPVYMLLIALTPVLLGAHRRWGLAAPAVMALAAAGVDVATVGYGVPYLGNVNYVLVWGSMYLWGMAWRDGTLSRPRWRPYALAVGGAGVLACLLAWSPFPVDMIGAGEHPGNTTPPSIALLAFAAAQSGLVIAAAPAATRFMASARRWRLVSRLNPAVMTAYLWHMMPVIIVSLALYVTGLLPQPAIGSAQWWWLRLAWLAALAAVLIPMIVGLLWVQRPLRLLPSGLGRSGFWSPAVLAVGMVAAMFALARLAISGFAPDGRLPLPVLGAFAAGVALSLLSGGGRGDRRPGPGRDAPDSGAARPEPTEAQPAG
jgi:fucose 4-O-acetylase-like acetyltransferase